MVNMIVTGQQLKWKALDAFKKMSISGIAIRKMLKKRK